MDRIYLDNAATSWPKPDAVYQAMEHFQRTVGAPAGRGTYREVIDVLRMVEQTRNQVAKFIHAPDRRNIAFTYSGTDSLCTAILGILGDGDHVVTSTVDHNSVLRPLRHLENQNRISVTRVACDGTGLLDADDLIGAIQSHTRLLVMPHVGNVTGTIQPIEAVGPHCRKSGVTFLVDAAQSLGHLPIDVSSIGCDLLAAPGHKGLLGPLGTGILFYTDEVAKLMHPLRFGGTGSIGSLDEQPAQWPEKFEAGNLNVAGIAGLGAGINFIESDAGRERLETVESLKILLANGLEKIDGISLYGPRDVGDRTGVFSFTFDGMDSNEAASVLDATWSIQSRAGIHCAPLLHRTIGTEPMGGTVRLSLGLFNTNHQIEITLNALAEVASQN